MPQGPSRFDDRAPPGGRSDPPDLPGGRGVNGPADEDRAMGEIPLPLQPGQLLFGVYLLERLLGKGGNGEVWLVRRHRSLVLKQRALKLIIPHEPFDKISRARFRNEAKTMSALEHPNAVAVYDAYMLPAVAYIEMEYVPGESLDRRLKSGVPMDLRWTENLLRQLCDVLDLAHGQKIIHRDLKPSNLILAAGRESGREMLKVFDFGIAKFIEKRDDDSALNLTQTGDFIGTPSYASPEQCNPALHDQVDTRSDLYSVGVILYELLTGFRPFQGGIVQQMTGHLHQAPPSFLKRNPLAKVPPAVEEFVLRCLCKNPADRPQSARELADEFRRLCRGRTRRVEEADEDPGKTSYAFRVDSSILEPGEVDVDDPSVRVPAERPGPVTEQDYESTHEPAERPERSQSGRTQNRVPTERRTQPRFEPPPPLARTHPQPVPTDVTLHDDDEDLYNPESDTRIRPATIIPAPAPAPIPVARRPRRVALWLSVALMLCTAAVVYVLEPWKYSVPNGPPVINALLEQTVGADQSITVPVVANDPGGQRLTYRLGSATPLGAEIDATTGVVSWTPTVDQVSATPYTIVVEAANEEGMVGRGALTVRVNGPPAIDPISPQTVSLGGPPLEFQVHASDLQDNALTYLLEDRGAQTGARIDPARGVVTWSPKPDQGDRTFELTVIAKNRFGLTDRQSFQVTVDQHGWSLPRSLEAWKRQGFVAFGTAKMAGGWPSVLEQQTTRFRYQRLVSGVYIPENFTASPELDPNDDGWPRTLTRADGAIFIRIPGGEFTMGSNEVSGAQPSHKVKLSGFYIQETEVTNREILMFLADKLQLKVDPNVGIAAEVREKVWERLEKSDQKRLEKWRTALRLAALGARNMQREVILEAPSLKRAAAGLDFHMAEDFALWQRGRVPSEAQWEFVARSRGKDIKFPWESQTDPVAQGDRAAINMLADGLPVEVKSFPADKSVQGVFDLGGNVREWCRDVFQPYPAAEETLVVDPCATVDDPSAARVIRGGSFATREDGANVYHRESAKPADDPEDVGLRLVIECPASPASFADAAKAH